MFFFSDEKGPCTIVKDDQDRETKIRRTVSLIGREGGVVAQLHTHVSGRGQGPGCSVKDLRGGSKVWNYPQEYKSRVCALREMRGKGKSCGGERFRKYAEVVMKDL